MSALHRQRGVGLVEVMVAMAIGMLLVLGAVTVFMQGKNTSRTSDAVSRMQENLRFAFDTIEPDLRMANFWGLKKDADRIDNVGSPVDPQQPLDAAVAGNCGLNWTADLNRYVDGRDNGNYNLACAAPVTAVPTAWSDVLVVRRASANVTAPVAGRLQLQTSRQAGGLFSNGVAPAGYGLPPQSETHDLIVNTYYVVEVVPSPNGVRTWALRRKQLGTAAGAPAITDNEVIRGIADLQVQFGVDTNSDDMADVYVNPGAPELAAGRVVSARLWLMAISDTGEQGYVNDTAYVLGNQNYGAFNDNRRRIVMSKVIQLRNGQVN
jgi:type IV pilus assembly protein PilW